MRNPSDSGGIEGTRTQGGTEDFRANYRRWGSRMEPPELCIRMEPIRRMHNQGLG